MGKGRQSGTEVGKAQLAGSDRERGASGEKMKDGSAPQNHGRESLMRKQTLAFFTGSDLR